MEKIPVQTRKGMLYKVRAEASEIRDGDRGFCVRCGAEADAVEPDARRYECEACGERGVYGLEELLLMGLLEIAGDG